MVDSVPSGIVAVNQTQGSSRNSSKGHKRWLRHQRYRTNKALKKVLIAALLRCCLSMCLCVTGNATLDPRECSAGPSQGVMLRS
jgi:hypothetical protein